LRAIRWGLIFFWLAWVALVMFVYTPTTMLELIGAPAGAALVCWVWYQFHKTMLIAGVRRVDRFRRPHG
jgi:hypothetical protein